ncbi:MAG: signal peptidase I [Pirellulales bacterium]|nr:signal peptidase I [Pirellulales bacterium]
MTERAATPVARRRPAAWLVRQLERCLALIGLATVVYLTCFDYSRVTSKSMHPTLQGTDWESGDRVLTENVSYWFRSPQRWEVITYRAADGSQIMKRVVGLPGEQVRMLRGGRILIDGREISPPPELRFLDYFPYGNLTAEKPPVQCGDGYYVLGDYTMDSDDSRFNGPVRPHQLVGRAWLILGPKGRRGLVASQGSEPTTAATR